MNKYYFEKDNWESCFQLDYFKSLIDEDRKEIFLTGTVIDYGGEGMYCSILGEVIHRGDNECGRMCSSYRPRNGKNGRCRSLNNCYRESLEIFILTKNGLRKI